MKRNSIINNAPITMNITTDLDAIAAIIRSHGGRVYWPRKVVPTEIDKENGKKIKALRKSLGQNGKGLTQAEFAKAIHRNATYLSQVECGRVRVSFRIAQSIYEAYRVYPDIKFAGNEKASNITAIA